MKERRGSQRTFSLISYYSLATFVFSGLFCKPEPFASDINPRIQKLGVIQITIPEALIS